MVEQVEAAKKLFIKYSGSMLDMHREGKFKEYKSFNISTEIEMQWFEEMINGYADNLSIRNWEAVTFLASISKNYQNNLMVEKVTSFALRNIMSADSVVRLMFAEGLMEIIRANKKVVTKDLLFKACRATVEILEGVITEPLVIDPGHELEQYQLKDKRSLNSRAKQDIEAVMEILN